MDDLDAYDTASQYGQGLDDTVSIISGYTSRMQKTNDTGILLEELDKLYLGDDIASIPVPKPILEDDFDGVLEDAKDDGITELPPHACRFAAVKIAPVYSPLNMIYFIVSYLNAATAAYTLQLLSSNVSFVPSGFATLAAIPRHPTL